MQSAQRLQPPWLPLTALFVVTLGISAIALSSGWSLAARLWGGDGAPTLPAAVASLWGPRAPEVRQAPPPPIPTPIPPPPPRPILETNRLVTYYGNPLAEVLGILGEQPTARMLDRLRQQAAAYATPDRPVLTALHFITPVAQASRGADGLYRLRMDADLIEEWCNLAERNGMLFILDVQIGRSSVEEEVELLRPWLIRPHVHLALDPEFAMSPTTEPGQQIGSLHPGQINWAIEYLADIAREYRIGNRILIVHQFTENMVRDRYAIETNPYVDLAIVMDGYGAPALKIAQYDKYVATDPVQYGGIKLFYKFDRPLMTPAQVLALDPEPEVVIYQ